MLKFKTFSFILTLIVPTLSIANSPTGTVTPAFTVTAIICINHTIGVSAPGQIDANGEFNCGTLPMAPSDLVSVTLSGSGDGLPKELLQKEATSLILRDDEIIAHVVGDNVEIEWIDNAHVYKIVPAKIMPPLLAKSSLLQKSRTASAWNSS